MGNSSTGRSDAGGDSRVNSTTAISVPPCGKLQNKARQIRVLGEGGDAVADVGFVDRDRRALGLVRGGEADLLEQPLEDRVQAAGADVLDRGVDLLGEAGDLVDRLGQEVEADALGGEKRR